MENSRVIINISDLPEFARAELMDYYEFLRAKYKICSEVAPERNDFPLSRFISNPIKVDRIKRYSRDDLYER